LSLSPEYTSAAVVGLEWADQPPLWVGDGAFVHAPDHHWGAAAVELLAAPGLRDVETADTAARSARLLASRIVRSLHPWQNAGGLEIRYVWGAPTGRLRVLFVARALGRSTDSARRWAAHLLETVTALFPPGYEFGALDGALPDDVTSWVEVCRAEEMRPTGPFVPPGLADYYYLVHPLAGDSSAWPDLPGVLARSGAPGFLSIALLPTVLTETERSSVDRVVTLAQHLSAPQQG
jgi:hypothetical protein